MIELCTIQELAEKKTRGFDLELDEKIVSLFLVQHEGKIYSYLNRCPHVGTPLNWVPDRFMDSEGEFLQCATHGAMFRIQDGYCEYGPCAGESLETTSIEVQGDKIFWTNSM